MTAGPADRAGRGPGARRDAVAALRVLVVGGHEVCGLEDAGLDVVRTGSAEGVERLLGAHRVDVVLLDASHLDVCDRGTRRAFRAIAASLGEARDTAVFAIADGVTRAPLPALVDRFVSSPVDAEGLRAALAETDVGARRARMHHATIARGLSLAGSLARGA